MTALELYRLGILLPIAGGAEPSGGGTQSAEQEQAAEQAGAAAEGNFGGGGRGEFGRGFFGGGSNPFSGETFSNPAPATQEFHGGEPGFPSPQAAAAAAPAETSAQTRQAAGTGAIFEHATGTTEALNQFANAPNPTTPSFTNAQVIGYGITNPSIATWAGRIAQALPFVGTFVSGALRAFGGNPQYNLGGTGLAGTTGGGEGAPTGAPAGFDPFSGTTASSTTTESGGAPGTGAAPSGGSPLDALAQLLDSLSPPGGGGGGAQPEVAPGQIVGGGGGTNWLAWLLLAAAAAGGIYWYYRTHHRHHAESHA